MKCALIQTWRASCGLERSSGSGTEEPWMGSNGMRNGRASAMVHLVAIFAWGAMGKAAAQPVAGDGGFLHCEADADCHDPYLACAPVHVEVGGAPETQNLCVPSYQRECTRNSDCGPAGFTCNTNGPSICSADECHKTSECNPVSKACETDGECPSGWSCFAATGGPGGPPVGDDAGDEYGDAQSSYASAKSCYPPYSMFFGGPAGSPHPTNTADAGGSEIDAGTSSASREDDGCAVSSPGQRTGSGVVMSLLLAAMLMRSRARRLVTQARCTDNDARR